MMKMKIKIDISNLKSVLELFKKVTDKYEEQPHFHWRLIEDGWDTKHLDHLIKRLKQIKDLIYLEYISMFLGENQIYIEADFHKKVLIIECEKEIDKAELHKLWQG